MILFVVFVFLTIVSNDDGISAQATFTFPNRGLFYVCYRNADIAGVDYDTDFGRYF